MSAIESWVRTPAAEGLGWALAHSVWQGAAAALIVAATLAATRSARVRYATGCLALLLMTIAFGWTWLACIPRVASPPLLPIVPSIRPVDLSAGLPAFARQWTLNAILPWLAPFWAAGVLAFHLRALIAWSATRRLRTTAVCAPAAVWSGRVRRLAERIRVSRPVALLESGVAQAPVVAGYLRPVILMPAGVLAGMPAEQVEAILLHELAHVRRHDYLVNILQTWVEAIFFYHPAAWWISTVIRAEREHCCDDIAVAAQEDAMQYAAALAALEERRWSAEPAVAATGGNLVRRIRRVLQRPERARASVAPALSAIVLLVLGAAGVWAWQSKAAPTTVAPVQAQARRPRPALPQSAYRKWVNEDVAYIISDRERAAFLALTTDEEREKFIEQFWERRDPTPGTVVNEFKEEHYRRIAYANERFADSDLPGWKTDRGRIYIVNGPPDEIESHPNGGRVAPYPYEEWLYKGLPEVIRFADADRSGKLRLVSKQ
jgi:GWxTD domain-containing protein